MEKIKINSPEVIAEISQRMGAYKRDVRELLEIFSNIIAENVVAGNSVSFVSLGIFYPYVSQTTGKVRLKFRPSKRILAKVADGKPVTGMVNSGQKKPTVLP
ncbi:MAG: Bacterial DNA-binding protein [Pelotomaculum sp. PtaB.Bin104]|nr:MAG: Bacterial DNA-binding protein [Pelotomaculum sp. PtaB.Bin104]